MSDVGTEFLVSLQDIVRPMEGQTIMIGFPNEEPFFALIKKVNPRNAEIVVVEPPKEGFRAVPPEITDPGGVPRSGS